MAWTDVPDVNIEPDKPILATDILAIRDNISHVRDGNNKLVVFTASGTYSKPAGLRRVEVTVVGGGGKGGGGSAGGAGGVSIAVIEGSHLLSAETVIVGAGATGVAAGGTSSFGAHCFATGGQIAAGGMGGGGSINIKGGSGGSSTSTPGGSNPFGGGGLGNESGGQYGGGSGTSGNAGGNGVVIIREYY